MGSSNTADDLNLLAINLSWKSSETKSSKLTLLLGQRQMGNDLYLLLLAVNFKSKLPQMLCRNYE